MNPNERVGIVLSGGGARAAYEVGVLKSIFAGTCPAARGQNPPEVYCGTGAGALNAAVICSRLPGQRPNPIDYLQSLWADEIPREGKTRNNRVYRKRLDTKQFLDLGYMWNRPLRSFVNYFSDLWYLLPELLRRNGTEVDQSIWHDTSPMLRLISESVSLEMIRDGEGAARPQRLLRVVATERGAGKARVFRNADFTEDKGHKLVLASCALPIMFPAVPIDGKDYMYGGLVMQTPLEPAVEAGCTVIHLVHNEPAGAAPPLQDHRQSAVEQVTRTAALALSAALEADLDRRRRTNRLAEQFERVKATAGVDVLSLLDGAAEFRKIVVHQHRPTQPIGGKGGLLAFERGPIEDAIAAGERDANAHNCAANGCIL